MNLALGGTDTGVWERNTETDEVVWDETPEAILGVEPGGFEGTYEAFCGRIVPADRPLVDDAPERASTRWSSGRNTPRTATGGCRPRAEPSTTG